MIITLQLKEELETVIPSAGLCRKSQYIQLGRTKAAKMGLGVCSVLKPVLVEGPLRNNWIWGHHCPPTFYSRPPVRTVPILDAPKWVCWTWALLVTTNFLEMSWPFSTRYIDLFLLNLPPCVGVTPAGR